MRERAGQAIGAIGPAADDAIPALIEILRSTNLIFCRLAAHSLARIGQAALPALRSLSLGSDPHVRREATWAVKLIEGERETGNSEASAAAASASEAPTQVVECMPTPRASHVRTTLIPAI
jgi:hypothetical protein